MTAFNSCREKTTGEKVEDAIEEAADDTGDALEDAADAYRIFSDKLDDCIKPVLIPPRANQ